MNTFSVNRRHLIRLLIMLICSLILNISGAYFIIYEANHYCDDIVKYCGWTFIICGILTLFSTISLYRKTILEVIVNDEYICINMAGHSVMSSRIINYSDIISISYRNKYSLFSLVKYEIIVLKTKTGTIIIDTISGAQKCAELIHEYSGCDFSPNKIVVSYNNDSKKDNSNNNNNNIFYDTLPNDDEIKCPYCGRVQKKTIKRCLSCSKMIIE